MRIFSPSTITHPWRQTLATLIVIVYATLALYWLATVAIPWATAGLGEPWSPGTIIG